MRRRKEFVRKVKGVSIKLHPDFYDRIDRERKKFMEEHKLNRLSTVAFTGILYRLQRAVKPRRNNVKK